MMRTFYLMLALMVLLAGAAAADVAQIDVYTGYNRISAPLVPFDPKPSWAPDWALPGVFGNDLDVDFTDQLTRYDAPMGNTLIYDFSSVPGAFGYILLGDGFTLYHGGGQVQVNYDGVPDGVPDGLGNMTDMWISLPGLQGPEGDTGGWHLIGQPYAHSTDFNEAEYSWDGLNIKITDGTILLPLIDASFPPYEWIDLPFVWLDGATQNSQTVGYRSYFDNDDCLRPGLGYLVHTNKDNLALILPSTPATH